MPVRRRPATAWLDLAAGLVLALPVIIFLGVYLLNAAPPLNGLLDGKEVLDPASKANYPRNLLELTSFLATSALLVTALWAFAFTKSQIKEARDTRLATLYATVETRWASQEMLASKLMFAKISQDYGTGKAAVEAQGGTMMPLPEFALAFTLNLRGNDRRGFFTLISLMEYLEYIGMLEQQGYIAIEDIDYILGNVYIEVYTVMSAYIAHVRAEQEGTRNRDALGRMPDEFFCLTELTGKFLDRYRST